MEDHVQALLTPVAGAAVAFGVPGIATWLVRRASLRDDRRETLIEVLRKALDKGRVRENAYCGALDALVIGIDYLDNPPPALLAARARALDIMEQAQRHIEGRKL